MPELPVLGPAEAPGFGGDIPRIPKRLPISEALQAGTSDITTQLVELARGISYQKQRQADADATINVTDKTNQLRKAVSAEPDLDKQVKMWNDGFNKIKDDFRTQAPNLGTLTVQSIADKLSNEDREFALKNTEQHYKKGIADVHRSLDDFTRLATLEDTKEGRDKIVNQGLKLIEDTKKNGFLDGPTAADMHDKFLTDVKKSEFLRLANEHPEQAMQMKPGDIAISATDFFNIKNKAYEKLKQGQELGKNDYNAERDKHLQELRANPALAQEYAARHWVTAEEASFYGGRTITAKPPNSAGVAHYQQQLQDFHGTIREYDDNYIKHILPTIEDWDSSDKAQVNQEYRENRRNMIDDFKQKSLEYQTDIHDRMDNLDLQHKATFAPDFMRRDIAKFKAKIIRDARTRYAGAKDEAAQKKISDEMNKQIDDFYNKEFPTRTTAPAAPAAASPSEEKGEFGKD